MYGTRFLFSKYGVNIIINGWWFSVFKNLNTGKWDFLFTQNLWRKTNTPKPKLS